MVNELVFRAADTATALEKVQDNLGENAFIIEILGVIGYPEHFIVRLESITSIKSVYFCALNESH